MTGLMIGIGVKNIKNVHPVRKLIAERSRARSQPFHWQDGFKLGPANTPAVPFAFFYLSETRSLMTDETLEVRKRYLEAGLAPIELCRIPDDHIGTELDFVYYLTKRAVESLENRREEEALKWFQMRNDFLKEHIAQWVPFLVEKIMKSSSEGFYEGAVLMLMEFNEPYCRTL